MKKVLITGANSYIGQAFMAQEQCDKMKIDGISVRDDSWRGTDFSSYDTILHVAAIVHRKKNAASLELYRKVNRDLPFEIAKKAKKEGVGQFIFISSIAVFGKTGSIGKGEVINNLTPINPDTEYGQTKAEAEKKLETLKDIDFAVTILRPPMVYGKNSPGNYRVLAKLALKLPVLPGIENKRSMIYIGNLVSFIAYAVNNKLIGVYSPQNNELVDTNQMIKLIREMHGKKTIILPFGGWVIKQAAHVNRIINKIYGSLIISSNIAQTTDYAMITMKDSILLSEEN